MRLLFTLCLLLSFGQARSAVFYMSESGSDFNDGLSPASAWKTIDHLSGQSLVGGDSVLFHSGHVFTGTYFLDAMGSATASVYLGIYNGALPAVISGSERITLWESMPGNVYKANLALPVKALFVNGVLQTLARHPNSGWLRIDSVPGQQGLISGALVEPDGYWNGASIRMRSKPEFFETRKVQSHAASQILFDDNSWTNQAAGFGFYFDGLPALLDTAGEWHYNPTADTLTFIASAGIDPTQAATNVQASFYDYGLVAAQPTWLVIENLRFERQAIAGVVFNNGCANVTLRNCAFAHNQLKGVLCNGAAAGLRIESCAFNDILGSGVTADQLTNGKLINNQFRRIGLRDGYGINGDAHGNAFTCDNAHDSWFGLNTVDSVAGIALRANGTQDTFYRNVVSNAVLRLSGELGAVSHYSNGAHHILYEENIFYNVFGNCESCDEQSSTASAFLFKYDTHHMTLLRNTVGHVGRHGIHFHTGTHSNTVRGNVVYNAQEAQLYFFNDGANPITHTDNTVVGNVFYSLSPMQQNYLIETLDSAATVSATDSNYYFNPYNYVATTYVRAVDGGSRRSQYPLETWRLQQPVDTASKTSFVRFKRYKTDDIIGANLVSNGLFTNNFNNWSVQPETGAELLLDNSTFMDGGCAKILRTLPLDENVQLSSGSVALSTDQLYQIAFSVYGTKRSAVWTTLYDFGGNFAPRSFAVWYRTTAARNNITDHFKAQASEFEQRLKFTMSAIDSVYWFDNISVLPVTATKLDSTLYSRLLINPSANPVTFDFEDSSFYNLDSVAISSITLQPFQSAVVIYLDDIVNSVNALVEEPDAVLVWPNPASDYVNVDAPCEGPALFSLYDSRGALVERGRWSWCAETLNVQALPSGLYMLHINSRGKTYRAKVSVVR